MDTATPAAVPVLNKHRQTVAVALVDEADLPTVAQYRWRLHNGYARGYRAGVSIFMHRLLLGEAVTHQVDHRNRNRLDNRRQNLRACTVSENSQNLSGRASSGHRGISWSAKDNKWVARVQRHRGVALFRRRFSTLAEAVAAVKHARSTFMPFSEEATCQ